MRALLALLVLGAAVWAAPTYQNPQEELSALQSRIQDLQRQLKAQDTYGYSNLNAFAPPEKRMVAWQPMKRAGNGGVEREPLLRAIEGQLSDILRAGEKLGVSPDEVLNDLRQRNTMIGQ
ncbi:unnamed protein product, partial [Mesorhabditis spiculigera]